MQRMAALAVTSVFAVAVSACMDDSGEVTLAQLAGQQQAYDGRAVATQGILRTHASPRHHWIEDDALNRVELIHADDLGSRVGKRLAVRGKFRYAADQGRRIEVRHLELAP